MRQYTRRFRVRHYELDSFNHVNNAVYANYMQEAAIEASTEAGYSPAWYREHGTSWFIRQLSIRYHLQASYGDELDVTTWVSDMRRVTSNREYKITRVSDGALVARARVNWVYIDFQTGQPLRIPKEFEKDFEPAGELEALGIRIQNPRMPENAFHYRTQRRVQTHELDTAQHVNNAVYLHWATQSYFDAIRTAGHPIESVRNDWFVMQGGHEIEYFEPACDNDPIEVVSWIGEMGKVRGAWIHEIYNAATGKLLARDYSLGVFVTRDGKLFAPPAEIVENVIRGPQPA
jgi:acyl-CoA thioester hydrolase